MARRRALQLRSDQLGSFHFNLRPLSLPYILLFTASPSSRKQCPSSQFSPPPATLQRRRESLIVSASSRCVVENRKNRNYRAFDTRTTGKSRLLACGKRAHAASHLPELPAVPSVISHPRRVRRAPARASLPLLGQIASSSAQISQIQQMPLFLSLPTHAQRRCLPNPHSPPAIFAADALWQDAAFISALRCTANASA